MAVYAVTWSVPEPRTGLRAAQDWLHSIGVEAFPSTWFVKTRLTAEEVRNALAALLGPDAPILVQGVSRAAGLALSASVRPPVLAWLLRAGAYETPPAAPLVRSGR